MAILMVLLFLMWCRGLMGFGVLGLVGLVFLISSIPCFFPWEAQNFWNYLSSQSNSQAQYCNYLTDIGITCCLQHIKSYMGYEIKIYKKADTECNSAEFGVWNLSEISQSVIYFLRGLFVVCFLCTYITSTSVLFIGRKENWMAECHGMSIAGIGKMSITKASVSLHLPARGHCYSSRTI